MPPAILLVILAGYINEYLLVYGAITAHELAHMAVLGVLGGKIRSASLYPTGLSIAADENGKRNGGSFLILLSGPFTNLLLFALFTALSTYSGTETGNIDFFAAANLCLAIFNMIPVLPLDGGRILQMLLIKTKGYIMAGRLTHYVSLGFSLFISVAGLAQLIYSRANFSLLCIGIYIMYAGSSEKAEAALMNIKQIIYRRSRILKKGIYQARDLVVLMDTKLSEIIKSMDYDRFHIIYVLDGKLSIAGFFTEQEIMDALLNNNADMNFEDMINARKEEREEASNRLPPLVKPPVL